MKPEKEKILIVDDNASNLKLLFDYLTSSGYETLIAEDGEEALVHAEKAMPGIILLDIMMPGIDGFETCRRLKQKESTKEIPVIFMTALTGTVDKVRGFKTGAVDYVTKPFQQEEVLSRITAHLTIQRQKKELAELNAAKDKFFSIIGHDVKNALNVLFYGSRLLSESVSQLGKDEIAKYADEMHNSLKTVYSLLENLLVWVRIQKGKMEVKQRIFDFNLFVSSHIYNFQTKAEQKNIRLSHSVDTGTFVYADPDMADTILRNFIFNALKFTNSGGKVTVSAKNAGEFVQVSVCDTGIGISPKNAKNLLKIDNIHRDTGTAGEKGTGLGLILCREFVEMNNGEIQIQSELGKGTTFIFTLQKAKTELFRKNKKV